MPYPAALHRNTWLPLDGEPVTYDGVDCCIFVEEFGEGEISVELIPEDEDEGEQWPLDVLALPAEKRQWILEQVK